MLLAKQGLQLRMVASSLFGLEFLKGKDSFQSQLKAGEFFIPISGYRRYKSISTDLIYCS